MLVSYFMLVSQYKLAPSTCITGLVTNSVIIDIPKEGLVNEVLNLGLYLKSQVHTFTYLQRHTQLC